MISFEEIKRYLPYYLSAEDRHKLFEDLKKFPQNIDKRMYSESLLANPIIYQGDGIDGLMVYNPPETDAHPSLVCVLSNSCDIDQANRRFFESRIVYCPIFKLPKYRTALIQEYVETGRYSIESVEAHIQAIKEQFITQILYLPKSGRLTEDSIVFLDRPINFPLQKLDLESIANKKIFILSNYGFYIFLIKLSIHFTRIQEGISRPH
jgi:hypothetical protein